MICYKVECILPLFSYNGVFDMLHPSLKPASQFFCIDIARIKKSHHWKRQQPMRLIVTGLYKDMEFESENGRNRIVEQIVDVAESMKVATLLDWATNRNYI